MIIMDGTLEFTDQQEFYNDFNDYTFTVKVPKNYIVWATGDCRIRTRYCSRIREEIKGIHGNGFCYPYCSKRRASEKI